MNLYNTSALLGVIDAMDKPSSFLLDLYFPSQQTFETEEVYLDKLDVAKRVAPYVSPMVAGKPRRQRGYTTRTLQPASVKPKHTVEPAKALKRAAGERIGGEMSPEQRFNMAVAQNLADEEDEIARRENQMAAEILRTGSVTVASPDHETLYVDFGRAAGLTKALTSTARWGEAGVKPYKNLTTWAAQIASTAGVAANHVVLDPLAAEILLDDEYFQKILDNRRQASGSMEFLGQVSGAVGKEAVYLGSAGIFEFYQYQETYQDDAGVTQKMIPDYSVILGNPAMAEGIRTYGAILDKKAGLKPLPRFPKMWDEEDPPVTQTMTQSRPLPVLGRPDATCFVSVR